MFGRNHLWSATRTLVAVGIILALVLGSVLSSQPAEAAGFFNRPPAAKPSSSGSTPTKLAGKISETSPPEVIQALRQQLETYQPQVSILSPKQNEVLQDNTVNVRFQVKDLPLFKDEKLGLGPHLHVFLDNQPYQAVYDANQALTLKEVAPGTHTLRVFASRPWHESFKNEGAYAQTTFHIFTKTQDNNPNPDLPLLTYSRPQASYGAEPIMLDFYLTNAPLHLVAQENPQDDIADWRIRCTINGDSFVLDRWQPVYIKGFKPGKNWVQLEYLDEQGNPIKNVFNNTVRLITYEPGGKDTLAKLTRGELTVAEARGIVDPTYKPEPPVKPEPSPSSSPTPTPKPEATPQPKAIPTATPSPSPATKVEPTPPVSAPIPVPIAPAPSPKATKSPEVKAPALPDVDKRLPATAKPTPSPAATEDLKRKEFKQEESKQDEFKRDEVNPTPSATPKLAEPKAEPAEPTKPGGFFNRFRRPADKPAAPTPAVTPKPRATETPVVKPSIAPVPQPQKTVEPSITAPEKPEKSVEPKIIAPEKASPVNKIPQPSVTPKSAPPVTPKPATPKPEASTPPRQPAIETPTPAPSPSSSPSPASEKSPIDRPSKSNLNRYFDRLRRPTPSPTVPTTAPSPAPTSALVKPVSPESSPEPVAPTPSPTSPISK